MTNNQLGTQVLEHFEAISKIYRNSGQEYKISDYIIQFAKERGLMHCCDDFYNVIIRKEGIHCHTQTPVILQAHMDMVCVAEPEHYNWEQNAVMINIYEENKIRKMRGGIKKKDSLGNDPEDYEYLTTLGADDGIGVAIAMAILGSNEISHPPLMVIFTSQEESGMGGAGGLKIDNIKKIADGLDLKKANFINLDEEEYGRFCIGCAGGIRANLYLPYEVVDVSADHTYYKLSITGLQGGHSGLDINKNRANAHRLMGRVLNHLLQQKINVCFVKKLYSPNEKENAIPKSCEAIVTIPTIQETSFMDELLSIKERLVNEYNHGRPCITENIEIAARQNADYIQDKVFTNESLKKLIYLLLTLPNDVLAMDLNIPGLVETSSNMGVFRHVEDGIKELEMVECCGGKYQFERSVPPEMLSKPANQAFKHKLKYECAIRSSVESRKQFVVTQMSCLAESLGGYLVTGSEYPGWIAKKDSYLQKIFEQVYQEQTGAKPKVWAAHAGLECGYFAKLFGDINIISCGATVHDVHTVNEILYLDTITGTVNLVVGVLSKLSN
jgi:dipeptidase D